jgi:hypothetical protein
MDKNRFNRELRPRLTEIRIGTQGVAFDRLEMEAAPQTTISPATGVPRLNPKGASHATT